MLPSQSTISVALWSLNLGHFHPFGHASHDAEVPAPWAAHRPAVHAEHVRWFDSYLPAGHAVHVVAGTSAFTMEPAAHTPLHAVMVPSAANE